jgi:hypothetical protein
MLKKVMQKDCAEPYRMNNLFRISGCDILPSSTGAIALAVPLFLSLLPTMIDKLQFL